MSKRNFLHINDLKKEQLYSILEKASWIKTKFNELLPHLNKSVKQIICYGDSGNYIFNELAEFENKIVIRDFFSAVNIAIELNP